ncbi:hypothetical protein RMQ97_00675 [Maricaulis sp. D1M11]|uniref:hypothetical protein n=1 Tax=Maricaulis sp. D1M11 TaxID=3076117 RepID=UPI0039B3758F
MNIWFLIAGGLGVLTCLAHVFLGGREVAKPLLQADGLTSLTRFTQYFCWHIVTLVLAVQAASFFYAGVYPAGADIAVVMTILSLGTALWNFAMNYAHRLKWQRHPQFVFFVPMTILGGAGIFAG